MQSSNVFYLPNVKKWIKPVTQVLVGQSLFQLIGIGISFILVRKLPKQEYAVYTILTSIQAMLSIISASGIMTGFQKIGGQVWNNDILMASLIKTASSIRAKIFLASLIIVNSYGFFILYRQHIPILNIILFLISISIIVVPEIQKAFIQITLHLRKQVGTVSIMNIINQGTRLILIGLMYYLNILSIEVVLIITILSTWLSYSYISKKVEHIRKLKSEINPEYKQTLLYYIKRNWHNAAFFAFNGQISFFLIGIFGSTSKLADLGALTRYSQGFLVLNALISNIYVHAFSRNSDKNKLYKQYTVAVIAILIFSFFTIILVSQLDNYLLLFLGKGYAGLNKELLLVFISNLINLLLTLVHGLNTSKGWIRYSTSWTIPLNVLTLIIGIYFINFSELYGVLQLSILTTSSRLILAFFNSWAGFKSIK